MAKSNKYTSINFNDIFEKKSNNNKSSSSSPSTSSSSSPSLRNTPRTHGGMLVLTRPTPKPLPQIFQSQTPKPHHHHQQIDANPQPRSEPITPSDPISLRPLGRTGSSTLTPSSPSPIDRDREPLPSPSPLVSSKPEPFVPPHLRPGFVGKEERIGQNGQKNQGLRSPGVVVQSGYDLNGRPKSGGYDVNGRPKSGGGYDVNGRPKSGGGYERMRRGSGDSDLANMNMNRPSSSGNRPSSGGGWYGSPSYRSTPHF